MRQDIAENWVAALRSGQYPQGVGKLRRADNTLCCLGVLCELAVTMEIIPPPELVHGGYYMYDTPSGNYLSEGIGYLPNAVRVWAEMDTTKGEFVNRIGVITSLTILNDTGKTFDEIADVIEEEAAKL